jgi:cellulose synthase/poly-beta-1,6-N-acetylglucosamine synthase-like glycosyltransferase
LVINIHSFISLILAFGYAAIVLYFRKGWLNVPEFRPRSRTFATRVSVLIAARNEESNIHLTINDLLAQDYPRELTEIIIVDDHSTDRTAEIIQSYAGQGITLLRLNEEKPLNSYKKKAISEAIARSSGELMVTTDADCRMDSRWLSTIAAFYEDRGMKMISSPVTFFEERSTFERLQTLEFFYLIGLGASMIGNRNPTTCNGANFAYTKNVFNEVGGFRGIDDLASGDDELLLHKVGARYPDKIGFCMSTDAIVRTHAKHNLRAFMTQRKRWASKTVKYKNKSMVRLGIFIWVFNCSLLVNLILGFFWPVSFLVLLAMLLIKFIAELLFLSPVTAFAGRRAVLRLLPVLTLIHSAYLVWIGLAGNSGKYVWKGRTVR